MGEMKVAVKGVLVKEDKMLIVKRSNLDETRAGTWESVGGVMEFGETFEQALEREFIEEVGLAVQVEKLLFATTFLTSPKRQIVLLTFLCSTMEENITLSDEHEAYIWASEEELKCMLPPQIWEDYKQHKVLEYLTLNVV